MNILIFTDSYPYDTSAEGPLLGRELPHLLQVADKIVLIPKKCNGVRLKTVKGVIVDESLALLLKRNSNLFVLTKNALNLSLFFQELRSHPLLLFKPAKFLKLVLFSARTKVTQEWTENWLKNHPDWVDNIVLYSYWFTEIAMGLGLVKRKCPQLKLICRAHGYDIYEEEYFPYYWPLRRQALAALDKLFLASHDGRKYFQNHYPEFDDLFETAHLGVENPGFISEASKDGVFRIISCAFIVPLKRINLLLAGIALAAKMRPKQKFEWHHFGDGKGKRTLERAVVSRFPSNATGYLPGHVPNGEIMMHYEENPVDVFVNLSTTEGGAPVSIQEAISCGIPVIATNVGGNPEIVSERNGILLSPNPTPDEVAQALLKICDNPEMAQKMRSGSRRVWEESYNADVNFRAFAEQLKAIRQG